jgi:hypothetical protein
MPNMSSPLTRRRGAQPGNVNAVKQGFYAKQFRRSEIKDLQDQKTVDLINEISMLRVFMRRVTEKSNPAAPLDEDLELLRTLSLAAVCLNRLVRTQLLVLSSTNQDTIEDLVNAVWEDICRDKPELKQLWNL